MHPTGFGNVNGHLAAAFARETELTMVASGHYEPDYDRGLYPYEIVGCELVAPELRDLAHQRNLPVIERYVKAADWDIFVYQGDMGWNNDVLEWVAAIQKEHPEKDSVFYMPVDGDVSLAHGFNVFTWCSAPVVYTEHARSVVERYAPAIAENMSVIGLGCEPDVFYPLSEEERQAARRHFFPEQYRDHFIALNVNRNQPRKDLMRSMAAFHEFHETHPDSMLLFHSVVNDVGGNLIFQAKLLGCNAEIPPVEIAFSDLNLSKPWEREELNRLYNACDVLISTSFGEGWGLTTTEAMAAGLPVVVPANTANLDLLGPQRSRYGSFDYERGWGARVGGDVDHTQFIYQNGSSVAHIMHTESFLEAMQYVYEHGEEVKDKAAVARRWAEENSWERREAEWQQLLRLITAKQLEHQLMSTSIS